MKIIQAHNYYLHAGGEDAVVAAERQMLEIQGNIVVPYYKSNEDIAASSNKLIAVGQLLKASLRTIWNHQTYREFQKLLQSEKPDVVHCHNTFPLISPSIYWACAKEKVPVVQTLHNYRLLCLNAFLFRTTKSHENKNLCDSAALSENKSGICELCVNKSFKWPGIRYRCYRGSLPGSLVVTLMLFVHKLRGTWTKKVTAYIALTEFQKRKMVEEGLPGDKILVKSNFIDDSSMKEPLASNDSVPSVVDKPYCIFVGRLSPEKGCDVLLKAWARFGEMPIANDHQPQLLIAGDGPERESLEKLSADLCLTTSVTFLGKQSKGSVLSLMRNAQFLALPSVWYEGFPMTIVEAFSCGTPVVASNDGGMLDVIDEGKTGLLFSMGDVNALANTLLWAFEHLEEMASMSAAAHKDFSEKFSSDINYGELIGIYERALGIRC